MYGGVSYSRYFRRRGPQYHLQAQHSSTSAAITSAYRLIQQMASRFPGCLSTHPSCCFESDDPQASILGPLEAWRWKDLRSNNLFVGIHGG